MLDLINKYLKSWVFNCAINFPHDHYSAILWGLLCFHPICHFVVEFIALLLTSCQFDKTTFSFVVYFTSGSQGSLGVLECTLGSLQHSPPANLHCFKPRCQCDCFEIPWMLPHTCAKWTTCHLTKCKVDKLHGDVIKLIQLILTSHHERS